jgi:hypothetical protein
MESTDQRYERLKRIERRQPVGSASKRQGGDAAGDAGDDDETSTDDDRQAPGRPRRTPRR